MLARFFGLMLFLELMFGLKIGVGGGGGRKFMGGIKRSKGGIDGMRFELGNGYVYFLL